MRAGAGERRQRAGKVAGLRDQTGVAQHATEGQVGQRAAVGDAASVEPERVGRCQLRPAFAQLGHETALANARLAYHGEHAAPPGGCLVEGRQPSCQLALAADERRGGVRVAAFGVAQRFNRDHRIGFALQRKLAPLAPFERGVDQPARSPADEHGSRPGLSL